MAVQDLCVVSWHVCQSDLIGLRNFWSMTMSPAILRRSRTWHFLKRSLGIKSTSANWCVLRECPQEPLQCYWFRSAVKSWNRMVDSNSNTLRDVMKADISLGNSVLLIVGLDRWRMLLVICRMALYTEYRSDLFQCRKLNISNLRIDLRFRHQAVWREG